MSRLVLSVCKEQSEQTAGKAHPGRIPNAICSQVLEILRVSAQDIKPLM